MTALEIASQIREQEKTVSQVVDEHIALIEKLNPQLNAVVETTFDEARKSADLKDQTLKQMSAAERRDLPPLFGVPFTCKEMISIQGRKSTLGSVHRRERVMDHNATVVERIENAGGILLGTTNIPELGFWFECDNVVYGKTSNPYDLSRTSGGSSGGEAAIISSGGSALGIGSDIGGSIRIPASFCGIFGHKASDRLVPLTGHSPLYPSNAHEIHDKNYSFTVLGPLARTAQDLELAFRLMVGPDNYDRQIKKDFLFRAPIERAEAIQVFFMPSPKIHGTSETDPEIQRTVQTAARYMKELGSSCEELNDRLFMRSFDLWTSRNESVPNDEDFVTYLSGGKPIEFGKELLKLALGKRNYTFPALITGVLASITDRTPQIESDLAELERIKIWLTEKLGSNGVLIMPVHPRKAPKHGGTYFRPFDFNYTAIFNALGFPATAVPMGISSDGLPLSVQVISSENHDHLCLSVARILEIGFGGWQNPKIV
jgi:fatty acid amide hydrolase 2